MLLCTQTALGTIQVAVTEHSHLFQQLHCGKAQVCADGAQEKQHSREMKAQIYLVPSKGIEMQHLESCQAEIQLILILIMNLDIFLCIYHEMYEGLRGTSLIIFSRTKLLLNFFLLIDK